MDYDQVDDTLRIEGQSGGFAGLTISAQFGDLKVVHDGGTIVLDGHAATPLTAAEFEFV